MREFKQQIAIKPGDTLLEAISDRNISQAELAKRLGRPLKLVNEIIKGKTAIRPETALQLEKVLNIPSTFWNNLESNYQDFKAREKEENALKIEIEQIKNYPYGAMAIRGWVSETDVLLEKLKNLLNFFGVTSLNNIVEREKLESMNYRISTKITSSKLSVYAWLRKGIIDSQEIEISNYDEKKFLNAMNYVRSILNEDMDVFLPEINAVLPKSGVAFVLTENLPHAPINGAARWINSNKALIQMSLRNIYSDIFWFSFFHECFHILKHRKKELNIDFENTLHIYIDESKEDDANKFAKNMLLAPDLYSEFIQKTDFSIQSIKAFAEKADAFPGVVIGRLQNDKYIERNQFNKFRKRMTRTDL